MYVKTSYIISIFNEKVVYILHIPVQSDNMILVM